MRSSRGCSGISSLFRDDQAELRGFSERRGAFEKEGATVLGVSIDSVHAHRAWLDAPKA